MLSLEKVANPRELGGIRVQDGRSVKGGRLLRTAHLADATDADIRALQDLDVRIVIDLRTGYETGRQTDRRVPGAAYVEVSLISLNGHIYKGMADCFEDASCFEEGMAKFVMSPASKMLCDGFYVSFVDDPDSQAALARFFKEVLSVGGGTVLWHCTQGKDRTGLAAAFLLFALGASRQTVVDEFALSNVSYASDVAEVKKAVAAMGGAEPEFDCVQTLVGVSVREFEAALDWIDARFGGMQAYLRNQLALTDENIETLKEYYLV